MYKIASQNQQHRVDFIRLSELASGEETQSIRDQRLNYKRALRDLDARIVATDPKSAERKTLGAEKRRLCDEMLALPRDEPMKADLGELLIDELKSMVTVAQYRICVARAQKRLDDGEIKGNLTMNRGQQR